MKEHLFEDAYVTVAQGILHGTVEDGIKVFRGVPYAASPVGDQVAVIEGVEQLHPAPLRALDLRAGAAMVVAALAADGVSEIDETSHIERGYENIVEKLQALGADIRRVEIPVNTITRAM